MRVCGCVCACLRVYVRVCVFVLFVCDAQLGVSPLLIALVATNNDAERVQRRRVGGGGGSPVVRLVPGGQAAREYSQASLTIPCHLLRARFCQLP